MVLSGTETGCTHPTPYPTPMPHLTRLRTMFSILLEKKEIVPGHIFKLSYARFWLPLFQRSKFLVLQIRSWSRSTMLDENIRINLPLTANFVFGTLSLQIRVVRSFHWSIILRAWVFSADADKIWILCWRCMNNIWQLRLPVFVEFKSVPGVPRNQISFRVFWLTERTFNRVRH